MFAFLMFFRLPVSEERTLLSKKLICLHKHPPQLMEQMQLLIFPSTFGGHTIVNSIYCIVNLKWIIFSPKSFSYTFFRLKSALSQSDKRFQSTLDDFENVLSKTFVNLYDSQNVDQFIQKLKVLYVLTSILYII